MSRLAETLSEMDRKRLRLLPEGRISLAAGEDPRRRRRIAALVVALLGLAALALPVMARRPGGAPARAPEKASPVQAVPAAKTRPAREPDSPRGFMTLGIGASRAGALEEARELFKQGLDTNPANPDGWNNLGVVLVRQGDLAGGIEAIRRALNLKPAHAEAHRNLAVALERQGNSIEAIEHYRAFLALSPEGHPDRAEVRRRLAE